MRKPFLIAAALVTACFTLAVTVEPRLTETKLLDRHDRSPVEVMLGDARRMFAGHFFVKADVYFHSGYYPSMFDAAPGHESHIATGAGTVAGDDHEAEADFLGKPRDIIDRFSRSFYPSTHTHLDAAPEPEEHHEHETAEEHAAHATPSLVREMLPWLRVTASLDPNRIETYTVGAYWLRTRLKNVEQAEAFLRDGLRVNPRSYAILFELGRIYSEAHHDETRARNVWEAALTRWNEQERGKKEEDRDDFLLLQITWHLALLEQAAGDYEKAIALLELAKTVSPSKEAMAARISEIKIARETAR